MLKVIEAEGSFYNIFMSKNFVLRKKNFSHLKPEYWYDYFKVIKKHLKIRFLKPFLPKYAVISKYYNVRLIANHKTGLGRELLLYDGFEYKQIRWLLKAIKQTTKNFNQPLDLFLDLGANIGIFGLIFYKNANINTVHMFEPNVNAVGLIRSNILLNGYDSKKNLHVHNCAISDVTGYSIYFSHKKISNIANEKNHLLNAKNKSYSSDLVKNIIDEHGKINYEYLTDLELKNILLQGGNINFNNKNIKKINKLNVVKTIALDDMFKCKNKLIAIKIDIEGSEFKALKKMESILKNNKVIMQIEIFPKNASIVLNQLKNLNIKVHKKYGPSGFPDYMCSNFLDKEDFIEDFIEEAKSY